MALSGTITGTTANQYISSKIVWSATQNKSGNYSTVTATLYYSRTNTGYTTYGTWTGSITINGVQSTATKSLSITYNSNTEAITATVKVPHNADGSKNITISATGGISGTSFTGTNISKTVTLDTIPRASTIHAKSAYVGENTTITINKASNNFTHTITYIMGTLTGTIATKTTANSISWTIPTDFYWTMINTYNGVCYLECTTYNGNTSIGTSDYSFIVNVKESSNLPLLSATVEDSNNTTIALTGDKNKLIRYYSNAYITFNATGANGATIKSRSCTIGGNTYNAFPVTVAKIGSGTFTFSATDSRGFTKVATLTKDIIDYVNLTSNIAVDIPSTSGTTKVSIFGNCFNGSFGAVNNTLTVQYRYKENDGSYGAWIAANYTFNGNYYEASVNITGLDYLKSYTFQARAIDKLQTVESYERRVKTTPVFDWSENDFNYNVPVNHNGNIVMHDGAGIAGVDTDGDTMINFTPNSGSNTVELGTGNYLKSQGSTDIFGHEVNIYSNNSVNVNGMAIAENKVLWSGNSHMNGEQIITLSEPISAQASGIVLVFSHYNNTTQTPDNFSIHSFFVSKKQIELFPSCGHTFFLAVNSGLSSIGAKYLYFTDQNISGHATNTASGTNSGITFANSAYVLRYVIGV